MGEDIYVILINGSPYLDIKYTAIRTYKTRKSAEKSAQSLLKRSNRNVQIGKFTAVDLIDIKTEEDAE